MITPSFQSSSIKPLGGENDETVAFSIKKWFLGLGEFERECINGKHSNVIL